MKKTNFLDLPVELQEYILTCVPDHEKLKLINIDIFDSALRSKFSWSVKPSFNLKHLDIVENMFSKFQAGYYYQGSNVISVTKNLKLGTLIFTNYSIYHTRAFKNNFQHFSCDIESVANNFNDYYKYISDLSSLSDSFYMSCRNTLVYFDCKVFLLDNEHYVVKELSTKKYIAYKENRTPEDFIIGYYVFERDTFLQFAAIHAENNSSIDISNIDISDIYISKLEFFFTAFKYNLYKVATLRINFAPKKKAFAFKLHCLKWSFMGKDFYNTFFPEEKLYMDFLLSLFERK